MSSLHLFLVLGFMLILICRLTTIGIVRVVIFSRNTSNTNPTCAYHPNTPPSPLPLTKVAVEMEPLNHWSVIECQIAIICACLPTSRALFVRVLPGANTTHDSSTARPYPTATGASSRTAAVSAFAGSGEREKGRIAKTVSYSVDIGSKTKRLTRESDGFIQLKDIEAGGERG